METETKYNAIPDRIEEFLREMIEALEPARPTSGAPGRPEVLLGLCLWQEW